MIPSNTIFVLDKCRLFSPSTVLRSALAMTIILVAAGAAISQTEGKPNPAEASKDEQAKERQPAFTLRVTNDQVVGITLKAQDVKLKDIAAELSRKLKIPVMVTPIMEKSLVTTNFADLVLEPAMQMLAPQVFIDYEVDSTPGTPPRPVGIYLEGYNEKPPSDTAVVRGTSDVMVIEGNTEDTGSETEKETEQELKVTWAKGELSVKSKKQPLVVVLYGIANELGIPLEVKNEVLDLVTVNITKSSVESTLSQLGPNIRLYVRADLQMQDRRPLRMVLVGAEKKS